MRRTTERRRPKAHPPTGADAYPLDESCYRCRHGRGVIECACRYARKASRLEADHGPRARAMYAVRLVAGLVLLSARRFGPGVALVAARGILPKLAPALAAVPALFKSVWVWIGGFSVAAATAVTVTTSPAPAPADSTLDASMVPAAACVPTPETADRECPPPSGAPAPTSAPRAASADR